MSINPQFQGNDQWDVLQGTITSHFANIDSVLLQNECINGQYNMTTSACYAANIPVTSPGFTRVCFSTNGAIVADLENSYITAEVKYNLNFSGLPGNGLTQAGGFTKYFIGFKQSLDALSRYDVYVNSQQIYTQAFVGPESFVQVAGLNDVIRCNNPYVYTSYQNAATMDNNVCGVYVDLANMTQASPNITITIPIKINLHQFLMLSPIHYLPSFCGRWELELRFDATNLIICPVHPSAYISAINYSYVDAILKDATADTEAGSTNKYKGFSKHFTQIGDPFYAITGYTAPVFNAGAITTPAKFNYNQLTLNCSECVLEKCLMNLTQFQLKYEVYEALMAHYTQKPLIIPINQLAYHRFSHSLNENEKIHAVANLPVENCDSIFILIPETSNQTTCYYQPYLSQCRMSMGEFGVRPAQYVNTYNDSRFVGLTLDALNLENSQISAMNKDFSNSIMPHARVYTWAANNATTLGRTITRTNNLKLYDDSHFMFGLPLSQVGFQSGTVSSPTTNINFQFEANIDDIPGFNAGVKKNAAASPIIAMFLLDAEIIIQVQPNSDIPVVRVSSKSIV